MYLAGRWESLEHVNYVEGFFSTDFDEPLDLDYLLQMIDQPKSPRFDLALGAMGPDYIKETA